MLKVRAYPHKSWPYKTADGIEKFRYTQQFAYVSADPLVPDHIFQETYFKEDKCVKPGDYFPKSYYFKPVQVSSTDKTGKVQTRTYNAFVFTELAPIK